jgi:predicted TIM-barrel fold metal-dependent hydrolase
MIDAHAHAFPSPPSLLSRFTARLPSLTLPIDIERVAALRRRGPARLHHALELALGVGLLPQVLLHGTLELLEASMAQAGLRRTLVIAAPPLASNRWLLDATHSRRDRLVPVATLPELGRDAPESQWLDAWQSLARDGARGFKIHPNLDGLPATHPAYRALFAVAQKERRFVILHTGCFSVLGYRHLRPADASEFQPLFAAHPSVKVCLAHMNRDRPEDAWALMRRHEQLYTDTSWQPAEAVRRAISTVGTERILLGSDWPLLHGGLQRDAVAVLARAASDAERERIGEHNALVFTGEAV